MPVRSSPWSAVHPLHPSPWGHTVQMTQKSKSRSDEQRSRNMQLRNCTRLARSTTAVSVHRQDIPATTMRTEHATATHASPTRTRLAQHLAIAVVVVMALLCPTPVSARVSVGAVRWDAWYGAPPGDVGIVGRTVTNDLSPERFHYRLPFFAKVHPYDPVRACGTPCAVARVSNQYHTLACSAV